MRVSLLLLCRRVLPHSQLRSPCDPEPLPLHKLHGDGQESSGRPHRKKREPQATEEEHPMRLSVKSGMCCSQETREWQTCQWASLRMEECTGREGEARPQSLPPVSFDPWFGVIQFVLPGRAPLCKSSHGGASKLTSMRRSLQPAATSKHRPGALLTTREEI